MTFEYVIIAIAGLMVLHLLYKIIKNRGFRGAMFGAPVVRTIGEVELPQRGMVRARLTVYRLEPRDAASPEIGIEIVGTTMGSFSSTTLSLTREDALALNALLSEGAAERVSTR